MSMTPEREIRVTLLDGSEVIMNTGDRVLFQASRPEAIPLSIDAETIIDDVLAALEDTEHRNTKLYDELTEASNEAMRYEEESRTWEERHADLKSAYNDQWRDLLEAQQKISSQSRALEQIARMDSHMNSTAIKMQEIAREVIGQKANM